MFVKKVKGQVLGAVLSASETKAMNIEIQKQFADYERNHAMEVDAIFLWQLHVQLGLGPERLKRFYENFRTELDKLIVRYEDETPKDDIWVSTQALKDYGVDLEKWREDLNFNG